MKLSKWQATKTILIMRWYIKRKGWSEQSQEIIDACADVIRGKDKSK